MKLQRQLVLTILTLGLFSSGALAQNFYWNTASARSQALGGVYTPSSSDPLDALATNPAGLTAIGQRAVQLNLNVIFPRGSFSDVVNTNSQLSQTPGALPYGAFASRIGKSRFTFGIGFVPDLMTEANWRYVDAPGTAGATYGMQVQKSAILAGRAVAGLGFMVNRKLSVGLTVGADYNSNTLDAPYIFQTQPTLAGLKTLLDLHTAGYGWNGSVGARYTPTRKVQIGAAYKTRTLIHSYGTATGDAYAQFQALDLDAPSTFAYSAMVRNILPQSVIGSVSWRVKPRLLLAFQTDWVNWKDSFHVLPVSLTGGTNAAINGLLDSTSLQDNVPLDWKDQYSFHVGGERSVTENGTVRFGYAHSNNPVPGSTLTPLTAAIMMNDISAGYGYKMGRSRIDFTYTYDPTAQADVQHSSLLAGEYNNSQVKVGMQGFVVDYSFRF
jgi:long-subunit fatty acid transport protein